MRRAIISVFILATALAPTIARADNFVYSGFYCPMQLSCDTSSSGFPTTDQLDNFVSGCVTQNTGVHADNFFDGTGLDDSGCLVTLADKFTPVGGSRTVPHCCVHHIPEGGCAIHCDMVVQ